MIIVVIVIIVIVVIFTNIIVVTVVGVIFVVTVVGVIFVIIVAVIIVVIFLSENMEQNSPVVLLCYGQIPKNLMSCKWKYYRHPGLALQSFKPYFGLKKKLFARMKLVL